MGGKYVNLTGKKFNRLMVLSREENKKENSGSKSTWMSQGECGKTTIVTGTR